MIKYYKDNKIIICCEEMRYECAPFGHIKRSFTMDKVEIGNEIKWKRRETIEIVEYDDEYPTYDEVLTITNCPFCGKAIVLVN